MRNGVVAVGFPDFDRAVEKFEKHIIKQVKRVIAETAEMMVAQMKALAPVDEGNLRKSIDIMYTNGGLSAIITVGASYAIFLEFGTGIYANEGNGRKTPWVYYKDGRYYYTRGIHPQPFFHPAVELGSKHFKDEMNKLGA